MELNQFLDTSNIAKKIKLESRVVIHRSRLSGEDILAIRQQGSMGSIPGKEAACELEIAGQVFAHGKIIKRGGDYYFKITKLDANPPGKKRHSASKQEEESYGD